MSNVDGEAEFSGQDRASNRSFLIDGTSFAQPRSDELVCRNATVTEDMCYDGHARLCNGHMMGYCGRLHLLRGVVD